MYAKFSATEYIDPANTFCMVGILQFISKTILRVCKILPCATGPSTTLTLHSFLSVHQRDISVTFCFNSIQQFHWSLCKLMKMFGQIAVFTEVCFVCKRFLYWSVVIISYAAKWSTDSKFSHSLWMEWHVMDGPGYLMRDLAKTWTSRTWKNMEKMNQCL